MYQEVGTVVLPSPGVAPPRVDISPNYRPMLFGKQKKMELRTSVRPFSPETRNTFPQDLEGLNERQKAMVNDMQQEIQELKTKVSEESFQQGQLLNVVQELREQLESERVLRTQVEATIGKKDSELNTLKQSSATSLETIVQLQKNVTTLFARCNVMEKETVLLQTKCEKHQREAKLANEMVQQLQQKLLLEEGQSKELELKWLLLEEATEKLNENHRQLKEEMRLIEDEKHRNQDKEKEVNEMKEQLKALQIERERLCDKIVFLTEGMLQEREQNKVRMNKEIHRKEAELKAWYEAHIAAAKQDEARHLKDILREKQKKWSQERKELRATIAFAQSSLLAEARRKESSQAISPQHDQGPSPILKKDPPQRGKEGQKGENHNSPGTTRFSGDDPNPEMTSCNLKKKAQESSNDKKDGADDPIRRRLPQLSLTNKEGIAGTTDDVEERAPLWTKTKIEGEELEEVMALQMEGLRQALQQSEEEREKAVEAAREANASLQRVRERLEVAEAEGLRLAAEKLASERRAEAIQAELRKASEELGRKELQWQKQKEALHSLYRKELEEEQHRSQRLEQQVAQWHQREARFEEMLDDQLAEERERVRREEEALREEAMQSLRRRFEQMLTEQLEEAEKRQLEERQKEAVRWQQKLEETERRSFEWQQRLEEAEKRIETTQHEREARAPIHGENEQEIEERAEEHDREEEEEKEDEEAQEVELGEITGEVYKHEQEQEHQYQEKEERGQEEQEQSEEYDEERDGEKNADEGEQDKERRILSEEIDDADNIRCQTSTEAQEPEDERVNGEKCPNAGDVEISKKRETNGLSNVYGKDTEKVVEITRLQEMIEDRERQLRENERQMDELRWLKSENECLEKRLTEMRDMFSCQLEEQEDILLRTKNEVDSLRKSLLEKEALLREVEQQQKDEEKAKQDDKVEAENEDEEIMEKQKPSKKEEENPDLQKAIQTELHRRTLELEEAVKQRKAAQSQLDALQRQHNRLLSMLDDKETELNVLRQNMQDIAQSLLFSKDNNSEDSEKALRKELEGLKEKLIEKEQELDQSKTALAEEQKRMEAVVMEMAELEQERTLRQEEQKPPKGQERGSQRTEELEEKMTDLQHRLREKEELIFGLKQELSLLQQQQQDNSNSCSSSDVSESQPLVERIRELEREIAANAEDQQLREQEVVALREMNIAQEQEVRTLETIIKANEEEFMTTRQKYKSARMERDQMQAQLNICKRQLQMTEDKLKVMRSHQKRLEQKVKQDMKGDTEHLKTELKKKEAQVEDLLMEVQVWKFSCEESEKEKAKAKEKERDGGIKEEERQRLLRLLEEKEVELIESKRGRTEMEGLLSAALKEARQEARERAAEALALKQSIQLQQPTQQHALTSMQESNNEDEEEIFRWSDSEEELEEAEKETENGNGMDDFYLMKEREWEQIRQSAVTKEIEMDQVIDELRTKLEQAEETILEKESELTQIRIELQNREEERKELDRLKEELHFTRNRLWEFANETTIGSTNDEESTPITPTTDLLEAKRRASEVSVSAMERSLAEAQERIRVLEQNLEAAQNTTAEKEVSLVLAMETEKEWQSRVRSEQVKREKVEMELMAVSKEVQQLKKLVVERDDAVNMLQEVNEEMERNFEEVERQHETWRSEQEEQEKQRKEEVESLRLELDAKQKEVDELRASLQQAKEKEIIALRERTNEMEPDEEEKNAARRNEGEINERILRLEISGIEKQNALEQLEKLLATALEEKEQQWRVNEQQVLALTERLQSLLQETDKLHCQVNKQTIELAETRFELERKESIISQLESQLQQFVKLREAEDDGESEERTEEEKMKQLETELQRKQIQLEMFQRWELEHSAELLDKEHKEITDLTGFYETKLKEYEELLRQQKLALEEAARHSSDLRLEIEILEVTNREKSEELVEKEKEVERLKAELEEALRQSEKSDEQDLSTSSSFSSFFQKEDEEELTSMLDISAASSIASFFGTAETEASTLDDEKEGLSGHEEVTEKEENGAAPPEKQITTSTNAEYESISTKEEGHEKQKEDEEQEKREETGIEANDEEEKDVSKLLHRLYRQRLEEEERSLQAQITVQRNMLEFFTGLGKLAGREGELAELKELLCEKEKKLRQVRASLLELKRDIAARLQERERELEERERAVESLLLLRVQHSKSEKEKDEGAEQRKQDQELEGGEDRPKRQPTKEEEQEKEDEDEVNSLMEPMREEERVTMLEARNQKQEGANKNEACATPPQLIETTQTAEDTFEELNTSREETEERRHREDDEEKEEADVEDDEEDDEEHGDEEEEEDMEASKWSKREMSEIMQVQREEIVELRSMLRIRERKFQSLVEELQQARCKLEALQSAPREQEEAEEDERSNKNKDDDDEEPEAKREGLNMNVHALIEELKREREKHALTMQTLEQLRMKQLIKEEERDDVHDSANEETEKEERRRHRKEEARSLLRSVLVKEERAAEWVGSKVNALVDYLLRVDNDDEKEGMKEKEEKEEGEEEEKTEQRLRLIQDDILQLQTELQQNRLALLEEDKAKEDVEKKKGEEELETTLEKQVSEQMSYFFFMSRVTQDLAELFLLHHQQQAKLRKQQLQQQNKQEERNKQRSARNEKQKRKMGDEERPNSWQSESGENGGESVEEAETIINGHLATEETMTKKKGKTKKKRKKQFHHEQSMELASTAEATIDAMIERLQSSILSSFALSSPFDAFHDSPLPDTRGVLENDGAAMKENGKKDEAEWSNILRQQQQQEEEEEERWKKKEHIVSSLALLDDGNGAITSDEDDDEDLIEDYFYVKSDDDEESG